MVPLRSAFRGPLPFLAAALAVFLASALLPDGFWIMDEAYAYLQVRALAGGSGIPPAIPYPGAELLGGEAGSLRPLPHHYGTYEDGVLRAQYSPLFAVLTLPGWLLLGRAGLVLLPCISMAFLCWLLSRRLRSAGFGPAGAALLPLAGFPAVFYAACLWSHMTALALCAAAWAAFSSGRRTMPFILLGMAGLLREECLVLVPAALLHFRSARAAAGSLLAAAVYLAGQKLLTGAWLGTHLQASGAEASLYGFADTGFLARRLFVLRGALLSCLPGADRAVSAALGAGLWLLWAMGRRESRAAEILSSAGAASCAALALLPAVRGFPLLTLLELKHPLVVFPALWLAGRRVPAAVLLPAATVLAMDPMHVLDVAWGARLLLPAGFLAAAALARPSRALPVVIAAGLLASAVSLGFLAAKRERSARLVEATSGHGAVIATSWILAGEFAGLQAEGVPVVLADSTAELHASLEAFGPLDPVVATPAVDAGAVAATLGPGFGPVPAGSVRFDPALEAVLLEPRPVP